jgi:hypothetical protein
MEEAPKNVIAQPASSSPLPADLVSYVRLKKHKTKVFWIFLACSFVFTYLAIAINFLSRDSMVIYDVGMGLILLAVLIALAAKKWWLAFRAVIFGVLAVGIFCLLDVVFWMGLSYFGYLFSK